MTYRPSGLWIRLIGMLPTSCDESARGEIDFPVTSGRSAPRDATWTPHPPTTINPPIQTTKRNHRIAALYPNSRRPPPHVLTPAAPDAPNSSAGSAAAARPPPDDRAA